MDDHTPDPRAAVEADPGATDAWLAYYAAFTSRHDAPLDPSLMPLDTFLALIERLPWLSRLGQVTARDADVVRIDTWEQWPGPEQVAELYHEDVQEWFEAACGPIEWVPNVGSVPSEPRARALVHHIEATVTERTRGQVPYDERAPNLEGPWYGPWAAVTAAKQVAVTVGYALLRGREIMPRLVEHWSWLAAGHWPCDYVCTVDEEALRDVVERLIVY